MPLSAHSDVVSNCCISQLHVAHLTSMIVSVGSPPTERGALSSQVSSNNGCDRHNHEDRESELGLAHVRSMMQCHFHHLDGLPNNTPKGRIALSHSTTMKPSSATSEGALYASPSTILMPFHTVPEGTHCTCNSTTMKPSTTPEGERYISTSTVFKPSLLPPEGA